MVTNLNSGRKPGRGRPRVFDPEAALEIGERMFHEHGYDAVGLAALTEELGIKAPSFYAAFGSKAAFFERVMERYAQTALPAADLLAPGRPAADALADLLERAARTYAKDPRRRGCLVLEAARGAGDTESAVLARRIAQERRDEVRAYVAATHPEAADAVTDYVASVMSGLSGSAREGMSEARLAAVARAAAGGLHALLD